MESFAQRLAHARRGRVMIQAELAQAAGVSLITVTRLENAKEEPNPRPTTVRRLAAVLGVDPAWLLFGGDNEAKPAA